MLKDKLNTPNSRIFIPLAIIFIVLWVWTWITTGAIYSVFIFLFVGGVIGPVLWFLAPLELSLKIGFSIAVLSAFFGFLFGIKYKDRTWGQAMLVISVVVWIFCGIVGIAFGMRSA